ncbi:ATP-binding cassette sub-family A member 1-like protein, partial [Dinothrombium tinctorium]
PGPEDYQVFLADEKQSEYFHLLLCLIPTPNFSLMLQIFLLLEGAYPSKNNPYALSTFTWSGIFTVAPDYDLLSVGIVMMMSIVACCFWLFILWYFGETWPWQKGIAKPFSFPFRSFGKEENWASDWNVRAETTTHFPEFFENDPDHLKPGVVVKHLKMFFPNRKIALKNINLKLYYGQITVLLGPNGAGKTTFMNIISGMYKPTAKTVFINGFDIAKNSQAALKKVGTCPQNTILYDCFTIEEHIFIFGLLKGFPQNRIGEEVERVMKLLNLMDKRNVNVSSLSGGMKRRLQLAIAIVGGRDILILDEPSSGLDIEARRLLWDLLSSIRDNYLILITTHHMEEADCLADRIVIMCDGEVHCCGSSRFLKRTFNVGYRLRIARKSSKHIEVRQFIEKELNSAEIKDETAHEIIYNVPESENSNLPKLFKELERKSSDLGIESFSINITSLDDAFLQSIAFIMQKKKSTVFTSKDISFGTKSEQSTARIISALLKKRLQPELKKWHIFLQLIAISCIFSAISLSIIHTAVERKGVVIEEWKREMNFSYLGYRNTKGFCYIYDETSDICSEYSKTAIDFGGQSEKIDFDPWKSMEEELREDRLRYEYEKLFGLSVEKRDFSYYYIVWFASKALHSLPVSINILFNTLLRNHTNDRTAKITVSLHTFREQQYRRTFDKIYRFVIDVYTMPWLMIFSFMIVAPFPSIFSTSERISKAKLLQFMSGVKPYIYWITNFTFDFLYLAISFLPFAIILRVFYAKYIIYQDTESSVVTVTILNIFMVLVDVFSKAIDMNSYSLFVLWMFKQICRFSPFWLLAEILIKITKVLGSLPICKALPYTNLRLLCKYYAPFFDICCRYKCGQKCVNEDYNVWFHKIDGVFNELLCLYIIFILSFAIVFALEYKQQWMRKVKKTELKAFSKEDIDVASEREKIDKLVQQRKTNEAKFICHRLSKIYYTHITPDDLLRNIANENLLRNPTQVFASFLAVNQLSFSVQNREVFGLLGVNGAGKSTTFRMLVGDLLPTSGDAFVSSLSLSKDLSLYQQQIGYCPQNDGLFEKLTARETLEFYSNLRGLPHSQMNRIIDQFLSLIDITEFADVESKYYSGGTKRKLAMAVALIGSPAIIFLDEPSSGVDPLARRKLWKAIETYKRLNNGSVILSSHSMDECEALCNRIAILAKGKIKCLGSIQHLKSKFGQGFTVYIKLQRSISDFNAFDEFLKQKWQQAECKDSHLPHVVYHISDSSCSTSSVYETMEQAKNLFNLEDYQVSPTTLEQIFLSFSDASNFKKKA